MHAVRVRTFHYHHNLCMNFSLRLTHRASADEWLLLYQRKVYIRRRRRSFSGISFSIKTNVNGLYYDHSNQVWDARIRCIAPEAHCVTHVEEKSDTGNHHGDYKVCGVVCALTHLPFLFHVLEWILRCNWEFVYDAKWCRVLINLTFSLLAAPSFSLSLSLSLFQMMNDDDAVVFDANLKDKNYENTDSTWHRLTQWLKQNHNKFLHFLQPNKFSLTIRIVRRQFLSRPFP